MNPELPARRLEELVLVYAADRGVHSSLLDNAKRFFHLKGCSLCVLTHGMVGEKEEWRSYCAEIGVPVTPYHRNDMPFDVASTAAGRLPIILARTGPDLIPLLDSGDISRCSSVKNLRGRLLYHLSKLNLQPGPPRSLESAAFERQPRSGH
jgi:hypothetical protein